MSKRQNCYVGVDFDGTCVTHAFPEVGQDIGAEPYLLRVQDMGARLILYTMRDDDAERAGREVVLPNGNVTKVSTLADAITWAEERGIEFYGVNHNPDWATSSPKVYCHVYVDDASLGAPLRFHPGISGRPFVDWGVAGPRLINAVAGVLGVLPRHLERDLTRWGRLA